MTGDTHREWRALNPIPLWVLTEQLACLRAWREKMTPDHADVAAVDKWIEIAESMRRKNYPGLCSE